MNSSGPPGRVITEALWRESVMSSETIDTKSVTSAELPELPIRREYLDRLFEHLRKHSDLSESAIRHEISTILSSIHFGESLFAVLGIEEISFLIENNRYQERAHGKSDGTYVDIDVEGRVGAKYLYLISETAPLIRKACTSVQKIMKKNERGAFRLFSCSITSTKVPRDRRRLMVLEEIASRDAGGDDKTRTLALLADLVGKDVHSPAELEGFVDSAPGYFSGALAAEDARETASLYVNSVSRLRDLMGTGEDIFIDTMDEPGAVPMTHFLLWLPREKFQENYETISMIFQRKGISSVRQRFDLFAISGMTYIALSTMVERSLLSAEMEEHLRDELYSRSMLLKSSPVSVGEIRDILDRMRAARDHEKLDLIMEMQRNKQKEYLIPLMVMLNDPNLEIRRKAFGLIRHYVLNPDGPMRNDYYWSTLKNIFSAATVPIKREQDRLDRSLFDEEIINLLRFRGLYYETMKEPVSGQECLFIRINGTGIGKGGIRAHASHVSFSGEGALSTNMLFKCVGLGIPRYTIGKGGILGDLSLRGLAGEKREQARNNILNAYADFLYYRSGAGPLSDVPAGDVGIGGAEISIIFERITENACRGVRAVNGREPGWQTEAAILRENFGINCGDAPLVASLAADTGLVRRYTSPAITGKPGPEGLKLRTGATARGLMEVLSSQQNYHDFNDAKLWSDPGRVSEALALDGEFRARARKRVSMLTFAVQGFGKVGAHFASMVSETGASVKMISDASGTLTGMGGDDIRSMAGESLRRGVALSELVSEKNISGEFFPGNTIMPLSAIVDVVVPAALEEVISTDEAEGPDHIHVREFEGNYLLQGANGPATVEAEEIMENKGIIVFPDILANAGGVLASYMEWLKGLIGSFGYRKIHEWGLVHRVTRNLVMHYHPEAMEQNITSLCDEVYENSFSFIMRWSTIETITLSRKYRVSMRRAFIAMGIQYAADEGRLSEQFGITMGRLRSTFAGE